MVNVGEQTGDMPAALERAAERFDRELSKKIDTLAALIQPSSSASWPAWSASWPTS
jgi:type II secretory pathway component PulF